MPANAAKVAGNFTEIGSSVAVEHGAGERPKQETQNPADDDGVANGHAGGTDERQQSKDGPYLAATAFRGFAEGANWAGAHGAAESHFAHNAAEAKTDDKDQEWNKERKAAILADAVRKEPNAAHADSGTNARHNEAEAAAKGITRMGIFCQIDSPLFILTGPASTDAAENDTKNENDEGHTAVDVLADAFNEIAPLMSTAGVDFFGGKALAANPEEHNGCQKRRKRCDVNGEEIHPVANNGGIFKEDAHKEAERQHESAGFAALHAKVLLQRFDWAFVQVDQRRDASKKDRQEKHHGQNLTTRNLRKNRWQHNENQRRAALWVGTKGKDRWQNGERHENGGDQFKNRHHDAREHNVDVFFQIAAVNDGAAADKRQRKERLPQGIHPGFWIGQRRPVWIEQKFIAFFCPRNGGHKNGQTNEQQEKQRHNDFIGAFNP